MSFKKRAINVSFTLKTGALSDGRSNKLDLKDHRVEVVVDNPGSIRAYSTVNLRIFGMKLGDMNAFATNLLHPLSVNGDRVTVSAGDFGGRIQQVFDGSIVRAWIDFSGAPDVSFNVFAQAGYYEQIAPTAPNSFQGTVSVADAIKSLADIGGFGFTNDGDPPVTAQLSNQYVSGTLRQQMQTLAENAGIALGIDNGIVSIWKRDGVRDASVIEVNAGNGMIGYPEFGIAKITVRAEFNPDILFGKKVRVKSLVDRANGTWQCISMRHELATLQAGGQWSSTMDLTGIGNAIATR